MAVAGPVYPAVPAHALIQMQAFSSMSF
uniref:Uncharacterized protein n=1 Tax=Anguilla anguilla TaxID=7936 RepID=A0A0E9SAV7_ANGAN